MGLIVLLKIVIHLPSAFPPLCRRPQFANNSIDDPEKSMARNLKSRARGNKTKRQARQKVGHTALFVVTLLTPTDDPNTFKLVARNLKMKARGNQKNNEANQIKNSPHDTENHKNIVQNQFKLVEIEAWTGLGGSWGRPWEPFGLPRLSGTEKRRQMTKK